MSHSEPEPRIDLDDHADTAAAVVESMVREESGEWFVDIAVVLPDGVVRHTVNKYRSKRHADIAASWIQRGANRTIEGPLNG